MLLTTRALLLTAKFSSVLTIWHEIQKGPSWLKNSELQSMNRCDSSSNSRVNTNQFLQVKAIDECLKLHGLLCPPEFFQFHETLVKFFKKNFHDEIRRLTMDGMSDALSSLSRSQSQTAASSAHYASSSYEQSLRRSVSSASTARFAIPPIQVGQPFNLTPPLNSPIGDGSRATTNVNEP